MLSEKMALLIWLREAMTAAGLYSIVILRDITNE
jgi:hypothetical protein